MDIGWSDEKQTPPPTRLPQFFSEVASTVKHWSVSLKVYEMCIFKEKYTFVTENISNV